MSSTVGNKKSYLAVLHLEYAVLAEDEEQARQIIDEARPWEDEFIDRDDISIESLRRYPEGWDGDCCVFHDGQQDILLKDVEICSEGPSVRDLISRAKSILASERSKRETKI